MKYRGLRADEIEVRVGRVTAKGVTLLLYKDARCDQNILDELHGPEFWQRDHKELKGVMYGGVAIWNEPLKQWVWKWDAGSESHTEAQKGEASDSFKRACFNLGIGRELYTAPFIFVGCETVQSGKSFKLKDQFALAGAYVNKITYDETENKRAIKDLTICDKKGQAVFTTGNEKVEPIKDQPTKKITQFQADELIALCDKAHWTPDKLCTYYSVKNLMDLTQDQYGDAKMRFRSGK